MTFSVIVDPSPERERRVLHQKRCSHDLGDKNRGEGGTGSALILLYHRVVQLDTDPQCLAVSPAHFREHLEIIRREFFPLSLAELTLGLACGMLPRRGVVVTFDDGYADNLASAAPLLEEFDVPATVFVTPRFESAAEFWWDELERVVLRPPRVPTELRLSIAGGAHEWRITDGSDATACDPAWNVLDDEAPTQRQALSLHLCKLLRPVVHDEREAVMAELRRRAGLDAAVRPTHRPLNESELIHLAHNELIEIGAHTLTHPVLSALSPREQIKEIVGSRRLLEDTICRPVTSFAYPFGCRDDFDGRTVTAVRHAGMRVACANSGKPPHGRALVTNGCDRFTLPRTIIRDCDGDEFASRLHHAFSGAESRKVTHATVSA